MIIVFRIPGHSLGQINTTGLSIDQQYMACNEIVPLPILEAVNTTLHNLLLYRVYSDDSVTCTAYTVTDKHKTRLKKPQSGLFFDGGQHFFLMNGLITACDASNATGSVIDFLTENSLFTNNETADLYLQLCNLIGMKP